MTAIQKPYLSEQEYLDTERKAAIKSEYYKHVVFPMAGATKEHNKIVASVIVEIGQHLKKQECGIISSDTRVHNPANSFYTYPDVVVTCENEQYLEVELDTLLNPTIVIEVLTKSTQDYDRGNKFVRYRSIPSLKHYVLISSFGYSIDIYTRDGSQWILNTASQPEDELYLSAIDFRFQLKDMYVQVPAFES